MNYGKIRTFNAWIGLQLHPSGKSPATLPASAGVAERCRCIAACHALKGFGEVLREEVKPYGVGVTLLTLGTVSSPD